MGIDDGLHLPKLNDKPILVIFCEPLPSFEGIVSFTTSYSCTSPKYSGTSEWPRWSSSWYINKLCRMIMIIIDSNIVKRDLGPLVSNFLFINSIIFILFNHFLNLWVICSPPFQPSKQHKPQEWSSQNAHPPKNSECCYPHRAAASGKHTSLMPKVETNDPPTPGNRRLRGHFLQLVFYEN